MRAAALGEDTDPFPTAVLRFSGGADALELLGEALRCLEDVKRFPAVAALLEQERGLEAFQQQFQFHA